jgi:predicted molibdopterin-dependent oxidoreductase YjgC
MGADLSKSHQVAGFFIKRNLAKGTTLIVADPYENEMAASASYLLTNLPGSDLALVEGLMAGVVSLGLNKSAAPTGLAPNALAAASAATGIPTETIVAASREIATAEKPVIIYGKGLTRQASSPVIAALKTLADLVDGALINPMGKANSLASQVYGLSQESDPQGYQAVYLALGDDFPTPRLMEQLENVPFLAVQASYVSAATERADVVLPVEMWAEQSGYYLNLEGRLQAANQALMAAPNVRSNLAVLQSLAAGLNLGTASDWKDQILSRLPATVAA